MWSTPTQKRLDKIPRLNEQAEISAKDQMVHLHFFIGGCDWYITEYNGTDTFFGYAILNNDYQMAEWGYISFNELKNIKVSFLEVDCEVESWFPVQKASEIENIWRTE